MPLLSCCFGAVGYIFGLFGVCWVMPMSIVELCACWQGRFGCHLNGYIWIVVPHCLMWCVVCLEGKE